MAQQSEVTVTLTLTESEWCELANALTTKAAQIRDGHKLATVLDEAGVTY